MSAAIETRCPTLPRRRTGTLPRTAWRYALFALLPVTLGACEDAPSTMVVFSLDDPWSFAQSAVARGGLPVVVRGAMGDVEGEALQSAVVAAMRQAMTWTATPDLRAVESAAPNSVRVIVAVGVGHGGSAACRVDPEGGAVAANQAAAITMVLCAGDARIAEVAARSGRPISAGSPEFTRLMRRATGDLFGR